MSGSLKSVSKLVTGALAGAGIAAAVKSVATIGMTYQDTLNNLQAVSGATAKQMSAVSKTAKQLGADTSLTATSAADAATAMTELSKGGLSVDSAMKAAKGTLQLAAAAGIDAADAATIQSAALNAFSLSADKAGHVSDVLSNAANAAAGEMTDFAQGLQQSGAVAHALGISLEDTSATLGILANNGIKGSDAGTLLKSALLALESPSKQAQKAMDALGLTAFDAHGNFVGLDSIFGQLQQSSKTMTKEQYAAATSTLFGSDAARLAGVAAKEGSGGFEKMAAAMGKSGSASEVAAAKAKGLHGAIEAFKSQVETVQISIFEKFAPAVETWVRKAGNFFSTLTEQVPHLWAAFRAGDAQGIGEVLDNIFGNTGKYVATFRSAAQQFLPVWDALKASFSNALDIAKDLGPVLKIAIGGGLTAVWNIIKLLAPVIEKVTGFLADHQAVVLTLVGAYAALRVVMKAHQAAMAVQAAGGMVAWIKNTKIITSLTKVWTAVQWLFNAAMEANPLVLVATLLVALGAALVLAYQKSETFRKIVQAAFTAIADAGKWMWEHVLKPVWAALQTAWNAVTAAIQWAWNNILKPVWNAVAAVATWLWNNVLSVYFGLIKAEWTAVLTAIQWAWNNILKPVWSAVAVAAKWLWNNVLKPIFGAIGTAWHGLATGFQWVWDHLIHPVFSAFSKVVETVKSGFGTAVDWIVKTWKTIQSALMKPVQWVVDFVWNNGLRKLWNFINNLWGGTDLKPFKLASGGIVPTGAGTGGGGGTNKRLATGGVLPGYTPGRDVHRFFSPTGGLLDLSGGEAVMRPEFTKALGAGRVNALNAAARSGGVKGVAEALGLPGQAHKRGGLIDLPGWAKWGLKLIPGAGVVTDVIDAINSGDTGGGLWGDAIWGTIKKVGSSVWDAIQSLWGGGDSGGGGGGTGRPGMGSDLIKQFIRAADPLPYIWGGVGPGGYDCSGLAGQIYALATGRPSYRRYFTTGSIGDGSRFGFKPGLGGMLNLGFNSHHVVGDYGGLGFEARSTADGILVGSAATPPSRMPKRMHLALGGILRGIDLRKMAVAGDPSAPWIGDPRRDPSLFDSGGVLEHGMTGTNLSGKPEAVLTNEEWQLLRALAHGGAVIEVRNYFDGKELVGLVDSRITVKSEKDARNGRSFR